MRRGKKTNRLFSLALSQEDLMQQHFQQAWNQFHAGQSPLGYKLREAGAEHWLRFHSLPGSKRYPETRAEMDTVLGRANRMAYAVLGRGEIWLVKVTFEWASQPADAEDRTEGWTPEVIRWAHRQRCRERRILQKYELLPAQMTFRQDDDDEVIGQVHATRVRWGDKRFASLLRAIANDREDGWLWMSNDTGAIFAPYDGGADLFLPSSQHVDKLRTRWPDWLSISPSGL